METPIVYRHTPDMGEISGFGGAYEDACQDMLEAGATWLAERVKKDVQTQLALHNHSEIYGVLTAASDDAKALEDVVVAAADGCTGAMHQAVMMRLGFIASNGWDAYCSEVRAAHVKGDT